MQNFTYISLMKLDLHEHLIVMYIYIKLHEIPFRGYLVMAYYNMDFK